MLRTILIVTIIIVVLGASIATPFGALAGYLWFALFRPQEWIWIDISQFRLSLVIGIILLIKCIFSKSWPNVSHPISLGIIAFWATGLMAQTNAINQDLGWQWLDNFSRLALVSLLLITLVNSERRFFYTVLVVCSSLGYHTAKAGLASLIGGGVQFSAGLAGSFIDNNGFALAGAMIFPLLLATASNIPSEWPRQKAIVWGYRIAAPLTAYTIVSLFSRGGLLAIVVVIISLVMVQERRFTILLILTVTALVVVPFIPLPEGYGKRVETIATYETENESSALSRLHFWRVAWDMAADNPIGVGMFNFGPNYNKYDFSQGQFGVNRVAHNSHFQALAEDGFAGFVIWTWLFFYSIRSCFRIRKISKHELVNTTSAFFFDSMAMALFSSMLGFLVGGSFISLAYNDLTWITFALVAALDRLCMDALQVQSLPKMQTFSGPT